MNTIKYYVELKIYEYQIKFIWFLVTTVDLRVTLAEWYDQKPNNKVLKSGFEDKDMETVMQTPEKYQLRKSKW